MDIQKQVNKFISQHSKKLGAETIVIDGKAVQCIPADVDTDRNLMGGSREERDLDLAFATIQSLKLRKGMHIEAMGKKWKIDTFRRGRSMTTIRLIEPNRIEE